MKQFQLWIDSLISMDYNMDYNEDMPGRIALEPIPIAS
jgi:hypothetical protein